MSALAPRSLKLLIALLIPAIVIGTAVRLLATDQYLAIEYSRAGFPRDMYGYSAEKRLELASTDVHYVRAHLPDDALARETLDGAPVYNPREVAHMEDVRAVFQWVLGIWYLGLVLVVFLVAVLWQDGRLDEIASAMRWGGLLTSALTSAIAILAILAWQAWFESFHRLFFDKGSWLFSYSDTLIRLFPVDFWSDATLTITGLSLGGGLLLAVAGFRWQASVLSLENGGRRGIHIFDTPQKG